MEQRVGGGEKELLQADKLTFKTGHALDDSSKRREGGEHLAFEGKEKADMTKRREEDLQELTSSLCYGSALSTPTCTWSTLGGENYFTTSTFVI
jgi:hypothetical protein